MKYEAGDKLVLEITKEYDEFAETNLGFTFMNFALDGLDRLDSDYINEHFGELQDEAYNQGLNDAWELAHRLNNMTLDEVHKVYGFFIHREELFSAVDADEALAKLKAYEEAQEIKVGDIVKCKGYEHEYLVMATSDETFSRQPILRHIKPPYQVLYGCDEDLIKTGRYINILEQIGGE